jgi:hypothetical protein
MRRKHGTFFGRSMWIAGETDMSLPLCMNCMHFIERIHNKNEVIYYIKLVLNYR